MPCLDRAYASLTPKNLYIVRTGGGEVKVLTRDYLLQRFDTNSAQRTLFINMFCGVCMDVAAKKFKINR